jgi:hypothetical protein
VPEVVLARLPRSRLSTDLGCASPKTGASANSPCLFFFHSNRRSSRKSLAQTVPRVVPGRASFNGHLNACYEANIVLGHVGEDSLVAHRTKRADAGQGN